MGRGSIGAGVGRCSASSSRADRALQRRHHRRRLRAARRGAVELVVEMRQRVQQRGAVGPASPGARLPARIASTRRASSSSGRRSGAARRAAASMRAPSSSSRRSRPCSEACAAIDLAAGRCGRAARRVLPATWPSARGGAARRRRLGERIDLFGEQSQLALNFVCAAAASASALRGRFGGAARARPGAACGGGRAAPRPGGTSRRPSPVGARRPRRARRPRGARARRGGCDGVISARRAQRARLRASAPAAFPAARAVRASLALRRACGDPLDRRFRAARGRRRAPRPGRAANPARGRCAARCVRRASRSPRSSVRSGRARRRAPRRDRSAIPARARCARRCARDFCSTSAMASSSRCDPRFRVGAQRGRSPGRAPASRCASIASSSRRARRARRRRVRSTRCGSSANRRRAALATRSRRFRASRSSCRASRRAGAAATRARRSMRSSIASSRSRSLRSSGSTPRSSAYSRIASSIQSSKSTPAFFAIFSAILWADRSPARPLCAVAVLIAPPVARDTRPCARCFGARGEQTVKLSRNGSPASTILRRDARLYTLYELHNARKRAIRNGGGGLS